MIPYRGLAGLGRSFLYDALVWAWDKLVDGALVTVELKRADWHCDWCGRDLFECADTGEPPNGWHHLPEAELAFCGFACRLQADAHGVIAESVRVRQDPSSRTGAISWTPPKSNRDGVS